MSAAIRALGKLRWLALALVAGCFSPSFDSGKLRCSEVGSECPPGFGCTDGICYKNSERDAAAPGQDQGGGGGDGDGGTSGGDMAQFMSLGLGQSCADGSQCVSGICADNVCCDKSCDGICVSCSAAGSVGTCTPVLRGTASPVGHPSCTSDDKSTCMHDGTCDGAGGCALWAAATPCKGSSCNSTNQLVTPTSTCDGKGSCVTPTAIACSPYLCQDTTQCWPSCSTAMSATQCAATFSCNNSSCGQKSAGSTCGGDVECQSGHCADGVCCDSACSGTCERCNQASSLGTCAAVPAGSQAGHGSCGGYGTTCGSVCDGTNRTSCVFTAVNSACSDGNACTYNDVCNGAGVCAGAAVSCPGNTACATYSCNGTATCAVSYGNGNACDDGNACTYSDHCNGAGSCTGTGVTCPANGACLSYVCNGSASCTPVQAGVGTFCGTCHCGDYECNAAGNCVANGCRTSGSCP
jgi:hypothetical protein